MADKTAKPMSLQKALSEAKAHYDRGFISELVADMVLQAPDISWQRNYRYNFLKRAENPLNKPAIPRSLSDLSKTEDSYRPVICKNFLLRVNYWLHVQESLNQYLCPFDSLIEENNNLQQLLLLFDVIEENYNLQFVDI